MEEWLNTLDEKERQELVQWAEYTSPIDLEELERLDNQFFNESPVGGEQEDE